MGNTRLEGSDLRVGRKPVRVLARKFGLKYDKPRDIEGVRDLKKMEGILWSEIEEESDRGGFEYTYSNVRISE